MLLFFGFPYNTQKVKILNSPVKNLTFQSSPYIFVCRPQHATQFGLNGIFFSSWVRFHFLYLCDLKMKCCCCCSCKTGLCQIEEKLISKTGILFVLFVMLPFWKIIKIEPNVIWGPICHCCCWSIHIQYIQYKRMTSIKGVCPFKMIKKSSI